MEACPIHGLPLGLHVNISKCELYCPSDISSFPSEVKVSHWLFFDILGDAQYATKFSVLILLPQNVLKFVRLIDVTAIDAQMALTLLH